MPLNSLWPHRVDVFTVNDDASGDRMDRGTARTPFKTGVRCRVSEVAVKQGEEGMRETAAHAYRVSFPDVTRLNTAHQIDWTDPDTGQALTLKVMGTRARQDRRVPDVVEALRWETGEGTGQAEGG